MSQIPQCLGSAGHAVARNFETGQQKSTKKLKRTRHRCDLAASRKDNPQDRRGFDRFENHTGRFLELTPERGRAYNQPLGCIARVGLI